MSVIYDFSFLVNHRDYQAIFTYGGIAIELEPYVVILGWVNWKCYLK